MYVIRQPDEKLRPFVDQYWFVSCAPGETTDLFVDVYVDGRADLVFNRGVGYNRIAGSETVLIDWSNIDAQRTRPVQIRQHGHVQVCGVRFLPAGAAAFTSRTMADLTDRVEPVGAVIAAASEDVLSAIAEASGNADAQATLIDEMLLAALQCEDEDRKQIGRIQSLADDPPATVTQLAERLMASPRTVERAFRRLVGLSPKFYLRVARFQRALRLLMDDSQADLGELAQACGFYDQSHLVREFHALAGGMPREYKGYMPDELRDFAPNVVGYADGSGGPGAEDAAGNDHDQEIESQVDED